MTTIENTDSIDTAETRKSSLTPVEKEAAATVFRQLQQILADNGLRGKVTDKFGPGGPHRFFLEPEDSGEEFLLEWWDEQSRYNTVSLFDDGEMFLLSAKAGKNVRDVDFDSLDDLVGRFPTLMVG